MSNGTQFAATHDDHSVRRDVRTLIRADVEEVGAGGDGAQRVQEEHMKRFSLVVAALMGTVLLSPPK